MGLEFGKWLMDVAKYMLTALLLASFFGDMNTPGMVAICCPSKSRHRKVEN